MMNLKKIVLLASLSAIATLNGDSIPNLGVQVNNFANQNYQFTLNQYQSTTGGPVCMMSTCSSCLPCVMLSCGESSSCQINWGEPGPICDPTFIAPAGSTYPSNGYVFMTAQTDGNDQNNVSCSNPSVALVTIADSQSNELATLTFQESDGWTYKGCQNIGNSTLCSSISVDLPCGDFATINISQPTITYTIENCDYTNQCATVGQTALHYQFSGANSSTQSGEISAGSESTSITSTIEPLPNNQMVVNVWNDCWNLLPQPIGGTIGNTIDIPSDGSTLYISYDQETGFYNASNPQYPNCQALNNLQLAMREKRRSTGKQNSEKTAKPITIIEQVKESVQYESKKH